MAEKKPVKGAVKEAAKEAVKVEEQTEEAKPKEKVKQKKEKKSQKERPKSKKKHTKVQVWKLYEVKDGKAVRKNKTCPRCGAGTFLASYKTRTYCGKCGWSQIGKEDKK
jgi:small subunit ribosomal protein S27Ae